VATPAVHVAVAHTLSIRSLASAAYVSAKWLTVVSFLVLQSQVGNDDDAIIFAESKEVIVQTKKVSADCVDTDSRKAIGHV
jgi:hypothetical protein